MGFQHAVFLIVALLLTVVLCPLPAVTVAQLPRYAVAKSPNHSWASQERGMIAPARNLAPGRDAEPPRP